MIPLPEAFVVDASVAIKLFLIEEYSAEVQSLFLRLGNGVEAIAPDLLQTECTNILWRQVAMRGYAQAQARQDLVDLLALAVEWVPTPTLLPAAFEIATTYGSTAYDSCYLALAARLNLPLLTHDNRLANRLTNSGYAIQTLDALFAFT